MPATFRSIVTELWASMGQAPPEFEEDDAIDLAADEVSLRIEEYGDGRRLLVSAVIGPLAADRMRRAEQVQRILRDNLAFLTSRRACVHLKSGGEDPPIVAVSGSHAYDDRVVALSALIDDVLFLHEWHAEALSDAPRAKPSVFTERYERDNVIFRP